MDGAISLILRGQLDKKLPVPRSQLVRIFTSSTFTDTSVERNALMREVFPRLKDHCKSKHGLEFQVIDMRWGVRDEATDDHMTSELCMKEIAECQRLSVGPNFVTFLCQKYGYRPFPPKISSSEFELLLEILRSNSKPVDEIEEWFIKDENCLPPVYVLQPISSKLPYFNRQDEAEKRKVDQGKWWTTFETIQSQLRFAAKIGKEEGKLSDEQARKYIISVTHDEVTHGILEAPDSKEAHCICFVRKFGDLNSKTTSKSARNFIDMQDGEVDTEAQELLDELRDAKVLKTLPENNIFVNELAEWKEQGVDITAVAHKDYLAGFLDVFFKKMVSMIDSAAGKEKSDKITNPMYDDILQHLLFCKTKCEGFQGRKDVLQKVKDYVITQCDGGTTGSPLVLHGESGSGKTSVLAKCTSLVSSEWLHKRNPSTIIRFLGTSPSSASIRRVLHSLCQQIQEIYGGDVTTEVPEDYLKLVATFPKYLRLATAENPLVIFLDSLDQLSSENGAHRMAWLPKILPKHVALIVSTLPKEHGILETLKSRLPEATHLVGVAPFSTDESADVIDSWLASANKTVANQQRELMKQVVKKCSLPLFLKLVYDEVFRWHSYHSLQRCILHSSIPDMISLIFDRLEDYHGKMLVSRALAYITLSPDGLAESELEDLLSLDDDVLNDVYQFWLPPVRRIPPSLWTRIRSDIDSYLVEREAHGAKVIYWYHRQFIETARNRYLQDDVIRKNIHMRCAEYFQGTWSSGSKKPCKYSQRQVQMFSVPAEAEEDRMVAAQPLVFTDQDDDTNIHYNLRKLTQLPFHLTEAADYEGLKKEVLCNFDFISCKLKALSIQEVMSNFERAEELHFDEEVDYIGDSLRLAASTIAKDPDQLAPELVGRLIGVVDNYPAIKALVQRAHEVCSNTYPLTPINTCLQPPGGLLTTSLEGHTDAVVAVKVTSDNRLVVTGSKDNTVKVWTLDNGTLIHTLEGHREAVHGLEITPDDQQVLTYSHDGEYMKSGKICVWNLETGDRVHRLKGHTGKDRCNVALSRDGQFAVSGFETRTGHDSDDEDTDYEEDLKEFCQKRKKRVRADDDEEEDEDEEEEKRVVVIWSLESGSILHWMTGHNAYESIRGVQTTEDNNRQVAISYSQDREMIFWDLAKGELIRRIEDHDEFPISVVEISHDEQYLAVHGNNCSIHKGNGEYLFALEDPESSSTVKSFRFTSDNTRVIGGHSSGEIKLFGLGVGAFDQKMIAKVTCSDNKDIEDMLITPDDKYIIAATGDEHAYVYSTESLDLITKLPHITTVDKLAMTVDGSRVLTASQDKNVRVWDITKIGKEDREVKIDKHKDQVCSINFLHHQDHAITTCYEESDFKVWDVKTGKLLKSPPTPNGKRCYEVAITTDDSRLVGAGGAQWYILQLPNFKLINTYQERGIQLSHFALTPNNEMLVAGIGQPENGIRLYSLATGETIRKMNVRSTNLIMLPNGNCLNKFYTQFHDTTGKTKTVQMISAFNGSVVFDFSHGDKVLDYAVSSDYSKMVCGCMDKDVDVWHLTSRSHIGTLKGHSSWVTTVTFSPDNQHVASGSRDGEIIIWNGSSKEALHTLKGHESDITLLCYSTDGKFLFSAAEKDMYIIVWHAESGRRVMSYNTYSVVCHIRVSKMSNNVFLGLQDGRVAILRITGQMSGAGSVASATITGKPDSSAKDAASVGGGGSNTTQTMEDGMVGVVSETAGKLKARSSFCSLV